MAKRRLKKRKSLGSAGAGKKTSSSRKFNFKSYGKEALSTAGLLGLMLVGVAAGNGAVKLHKKDTAVVHGITTAAAIAATPLAKKGWLKALIAGVGVYSGLKLLNKAAAEVVQTQGLSGLPDSVKSTIRNVFPSLGDAGEGGDENLSSIEQEMLGLAETDPQLYGKLRASLQKGSRYIPAVAAANAVQRAAGRRPGLAVSLANLGSVGSMI